MKKKATRFFDKFSNEYETQDRYKYLFYRWLISKIIQGIDRKKTTIIDLGTGNGALAIRIAKKIPQAKIIGIDVSEGMLRHAKEKTKCLGIDNIRYEVSPIEDFNKRQADFVVSNLAFHHVNDKQKAITRIYRALKKGGKLIIGDWFKPDQGYKERIDGIRRRNRKLAVEFDRSWSQALKERSKEYTRQHPKEYPVSPTQLRNIMKEVGFVKQRIIMCPLATFAVVISEK
ncbi:Putative arsenite methyltransferase [uncultured archaeon]|nr:Putative arsenite methyltransferase [uncultured archaeon]